MAKGAEKTVEGAKRLRAVPTAGHCPRNSEHPNTRIYRTAGTTRYCKCNDCGATWKQSASEGDPFAAFLVEVAESLNGAERIDVNGTKAIVISDADARELASKILEFVSA